MASRSIKSLVPEMEGKAKQVQEYCKDRGVTLLIYCTVRSLEEQAILFRKSHDWKFIENKINKLESRGFGFLTDIIKKVGPQKQIKPVTNAAPGESFHAYGEAFDAVPLLSGKPIWKYNDYKIGWDTYAKALKENDLIWGGDFQKKFKDLPHAQLCPGSNPLKLYPPEVIKAILTENGLLNGDY
ncbi:M15 family metallopeptidase [Ancylomarina sp. DW003]|nr:M15 family metallopeptidase [Ancylomarina sp. DW003]MDE5420608.1 M15 family metallopeptidase [Ancylomarina sp. DW003]